MNALTIFIIVAAVIILVLLCLCLAIANFALDSFYDKYDVLDKQISDSGLTTIGLFNYINYKHFDNSIKVCQTDKGIGAGAYSNGVLFLTTRSINSNSLASFSIIAHELGHAKQDVESSKLKTMTKLRIIGKIIGVFMFPFLIAGFIMLFFGGPWFYISLALIGCGLLIFGFSVLLKAITIKIEKEASRHAVEFLSELLSEKEVKKCNKFLYEARLTYWGDMFRMFLGWTMLTRKNKS